MRSTSKLKLEGYRVFYGLNISVFWFFSRVGFIKSYLSRRTHQATTINERFIAMGLKSYGALTNLT
jgi:hypothetical protein